MRKFTVHLPLGSEHRWGERIRVDLPVDVLEVGRAEVRGHLKNLSLSGALLQSSHDLHLHALIEVRIARASTSADAYVVRARVSRKPTHGVGIEWCEFAPPVVKDLLRLPSGRYPL
jgi:hypothetical protein